MGELKDSLVGCLVDQLFMYLAIGGIACLCCGAFGAGIILLIIVIIYFVSKTPEDTDNNTSSSITTQSSTQTTINKPQILYTDPSLRLTITKNLSPAKKINHESFRQELLGHGIRCFYHFTDVRNLENIRKYGGLISWSSCETHDVEIPAAGGHDFSRRLDMRYNLQDYVRLSFCDDHPMAYRLKQEGKTLVLLKICIDVAEWEGTLFSNINATDVGHSHGGTLSDLQKIRWAAVKRNYVSRDDDDFKYHQAEILVKTAIPKEFIVNLDNPIYL